MMDYKSAANYLETAMLLTAGIQNAVYEYKPFFRDLTDVLTLAVYALRTQEEIEDPRPIPMEQLKEMPGEPIWLQHRDPNLSGWAIVSKATLFFLEVCDGPCVAYRYKPKKSEVHTNES